MPRAGQCGCVPVFDDLVLLWYPWNGCIVLVWIRFHRISSLQSRTALSILEQERLLERYLQYRLRFISLLGVFPQLF